MKEEREVHRVAVRFSCGREVSPNLAEIKFDKYRITTLPSKRDPFSPSGEDMLLEFPDVWEKDQIASNPEREAQYILAWLSLAFGAKIEFDSAKINTVNITLQRRQHRQRKSPIESDSELNPLFNGLCSLNDKDAQQCLRACEAYRVAVSLTEDNPTLAMFMLVTAVECLSNTFETGEGHFLKLSHFISSHLPQELASERDDPKFPELLRQCYESRSGFTHGGKPLSLASTVADQASERFVTHYEDGRETVTPGTAWFEKIVRSVIMEFLRKQNGPRRASLSALALQEGILTLRAKRSVERGSILTRDDVSL
jgi:hypothetical protein